MSQRFPQAHPPVKPWRDEFSKQANASWAPSQTNPRILLDPGATLTSVTPYYNARESMAAWQPQRALTDRARAAVRTVYASEGAQHTALSGKGGGNQFTLSTRALTFSLPQSAVPNPFSPVNGNHTTNKDTSGDPRRFLSDGLVRYCLQNLHTGCPLCLKHVLTTYGCVRI